MSERTVILDIDHKHFDRHVATIRRELDAMLNLYLPPRVRGAVLDIETEVVHLADRWDQRKDER